MNVSRSEPLPSEDIRYVGQLVAQRTGLSQQDAEKRVADVYAKAQAKVRDAEVKQNEMFPKIKASSLDIIELGARMAARKDELLAQVA